MFSTSDEAYWEVPNYCKTMAPLLAAAFDNVVAPVAKVDQSGVLISESIAGEMHVFFAVNVAQPPLESTQLLRVRPAVSSNYYPMTVNITLPTTGIVYDVLERKLLPAGKPLQADLRYNAGRIYAVLPSAIESVELTAADRVQSGQPLSVDVREFGAGKRPIVAPLPVMLRLLDGAGTLLDEKPLSVPPAGTKVTFTAPISCPGPLTLEAIDLIAGKTAKRIVQLPVAQPVIAD